MILSSPSEGQLCDWRCGPSLGLCVCRPNLSVRAYGYGTEGFHKVSIVEIFFFSFVKFLDQQSPLLLKNLGVLFENNHRQVSAGHFDI